MSANRLSGIAVALIGVALYFVIIPAHTEVVASVGMKPQTLPDLCAIGLILLGSLHALSPAGLVFLRWREAGRAAIFAGISTVGVVLLHLAGFVVAAPAMALGVMLAVGEKRPLWLMAGVLALPALIWFAAVVLLERPLP